MRQIRLLPVVVLAASALLILKTVGLVTGDGYTPGVQSAFAAGDTAAAEAPAPEPATAEATGAPVDPVQAAADSLFGSVPEAVEAAEGGATGSDTGEIVLQRLAERRAELDAFALELESRMSLVEAAELRIEERMAELSALEAQINVSLDAQDAAAEAQFAAVVAMYENMRAGDAATIFNDLDTSVLVAVGKKMNPRKLGPIMANMVPARAQQLTVLLAQTDVATPAPVQQSADLPQIVGQ
ncbi:MotE family protein [Pelagibacterium luteolum]|uniref:Flagellar motility protein MotE, a chaperone for MotC folding n=1 Tax=Pelagibacterium luteolum TaxID=440168 RepID=A0A1G7YB46_9HYPH|nr:hypothetical protein [Pelagibacterium luteolum]SDG93573.1 Flagellar motility protein MotE, a chaperone for MotC folding [Pelagibacterium luteolum]